MLGAVIVVLVTVVLLPVGFLVGGAVVAAGLGSALTATKERDHEGSELVELNV